MQTSNKKTVSKSSQSKTYQKEVCLHKNIDTPAEVALYYGFSISDTPTITKDDIKKARGITDPELRGKESPESARKFSLEEKVALLRMCLEKKLEHAPKPFLFYFGKPIVRENAERKSGKDRSIALEIMDSTSSIAEALLIKTSFEILREEGFENLSVHLNSVGDRDTVSRFTRELISYYRKNIEELPSHCRQLLKKDAFGLLACKNEKCLVIKGTAPKSMNFLSEPSRRHFKEVLEYLEFLEVPYEINPFLVGHRSFSCQTIFEINNPDSCETGKPLAVGVRYSGIAKKLGWKHDMPGIGARLSYKETASRKNIKFFKPKIYFIQLGCEAKLKSLKIIELLRQERIPMYQAISSDKLLYQLGMAEDMKIPYTIIMGQKEALEDMVIVRNMRNRSQETIKILDLPRYIKKL